MIRSQLRRCFCICCWGDGYIRKIAADEAEVDTAEQESFISAQIILSEEGLDAADEAADNGRDAVDGAIACADSDDDTASGERNPLYYFGN